MAEQNMDLKSLKRKMKKINRDIKFFKKELTHTTDGDQRIFLLEQWRSATRDKLETQRALTNFYKICAEKLEEEIDSQ
jgi:hypothetical protein